MEKRTVFFTMVNHPAKVAETRVGNAYGSRHVSYRVATFCAWSVARLTGKSFAMYALF